MEWWQAIILGLVEGITEYLPVSSTGHLIIASSLMGLDDPAERHAINAFNIVIQGGAILAVIGLYWPSIWRMLRGLAGKDQGGLRLALAILVAFAPAAVLGVLLEPVIERHLFSLGPVVLALALGGVLMIGLDRRIIAPGRLSERPGPMRGTTDVTLKQALVIGVIQCFAMWPGMSRSMMTICGGVLVGLRPRQAAEFSFLLGLPTLGGATVYKLYKNLHESKQHGVPNLFETLGWSNVMLGMLVAMIAAAIAVKWLVRFLNRHGLEPFGWYRLCVAAVLLALGVAGVVRVVA
ncbi:MAG: undecaprenyl-diphosphate phosphatase [Phycisphaeraceae bacterium]|nr:undecaprenyl-diphosphate phosphatase [Phycisphaeraceae bacterium]MCW5753812.1 undecaprenyl-diphosphate phosphatase [Phycisphaeraceae bacterium]